MDITGIYDEAPVVSTTDPATKAQTGWGLLWMPIELEEIKEGMTVRFQGQSYTDATIVSTVRMESFSETDEDLVVDAVYPNARVRYVFDDFSEVSYLRLAH